MKIAQIAPLAESVPPRLYGGTERVVSYLTEELVRLGHEVTLFASADSSTAAELVACAPRGQRLAGRLDPAAEHAMFEAVHARAAEFDVLHFHTDYAHLPVFRPFARKVVTTLHNRLDVPERVPPYSAFADMAFVAVSEAQRRSEPRLAWARTVHHGLPPDVCPPNPGLPRANGRYFAFLGRVSPEKGLERAIHIALATRTRLRIAAKVDREDEGYFHSRIAPHLKNPLIEFDGELGEGAKPAFLGNATALLFPIDWPEPFGLALIEAISCGTPVVGWRCGAVPEVIDEGVTGFVVDNLEEAVRAAERTALLDRRRVRARFEQRFTVERMARDYLSVYRGLGRARAAQRAF